MSARAGPSRAGPVACRGGRRARPGWAHNNGSGSTSPAARSSRRVAFRQGTRPDRASASSPPTGRGSRSLGIGDDRARVVLGGQALADQLVQLECVRSGDLDDTSHRLTDGSTAHRGGVVGVDGLDRDGARCTVLSSLVAESAMPFMNSKNWVACTMENGTSESLISCSGACLAGKQPLSWSRSVPTTDSANGA